MTIATASCVAIRSGPEVRPQPERLEPGQVWEDEYGFRYFIDEVYDSGRFSFSVYWGKDKMGCLYNDCNYDGRWQRLYEYRGHISELGGPR